MTIKYTNIIHSKELKNLPKLGYLFGKFTIWQPCRDAGKTRKSFPILKVNRRNELFNYFPIVTVSQSVAFFIRELRSFIIFQKMKLMVCIFTAHQNITHFKSS
jgi:hypothetical protein